MTIVVLDSRDFRWEEPPGHFGGFSKCLVNEETAAAKRLDFRISRYPIRGRVAPHIHDDAEQIYYVISGQGTAWSDDRSIRLEPGIALFIPPGVDHSLENTGDADLVFAVVTSQMPVVRPTGQDHPASDTDRHGGV